MCNCVWTTGFCFYLSTVSLLITKYVLCLIIEPFFLHELLLTLEIFVVFYPQVVFYTCKLLFFYKTNKIAFLYICKNVCLPIFMAYQSYHYILIRLVPYYTRTLIGFKTDQHFESQYIKTNFLFQTNLVTLLYVSCHSDFVTVTYSYLFLLSITLDLTFQDRPAFVYIGNLIICKFCFSTNAIF